MMQQPGGMAPPAHGMDQQLQYHPPPQWMMMQRLLSLPLQHQPGQAQGPPLVPVGSDEPRYLWIGDLEYWMDEIYLSNCFYNTGLVSAKVIRNMKTKASEGYGILEFKSRADAETALQLYPGKTMPSSVQSFQMNWAWASPEGNRCEFVPFDERDMLNMNYQLTSNGIMLGALNIQNMRHVWGHTPWTKQLHQYLQSGYAAQPQDPSMNNGGGYPGNGNYQQPQQSYIQRYEGHGGYAAQPQDPSKYNGGGYPRNGNYQQPQQSYSQRYERHGGYAAQPQDPSMYNGGGYPGNGNYQQPQQ